MMKRLFLTNPEFVKNILHLHYFKTALYYNGRMSDFPNLKISQQLKIFLSLLDYAKGCSLENGIYKFTFETSFLGLPSQTPFEILFNELLKSCNQSMDIEDMYKKIYESDNPVSIYLAEKLKSKNLSLSSELFEFVNRKECDYQKKWQSDEFISGNWNYILLALNQNVWQTAFDQTEINRLFLNEKKELDKIDEGNLHGDGYPKYLENLDSLIIRKLS